jgi:asparagine synthase (glutamine-hydrolysing)
LSPIVWRHPFLDLRVLGFMLAVPPVPWGWNKLLLRRAMAGRLPAELLARPKAAPEPPTVPLPGGHAMAPLAASQRLAAFIDLERLPGKEASRTEFDMALSAHALDYWLATEGGAVQIGGPLLWQSGC